MKLSIIKTIFGDFACYGKLFRVINALVINNTQIETSRPEYILV